MENTFVLLVIAGSSFDEPLEKVLSKYSDVLALDNPNVMINVLVKKTFYAVLPDETVVEIGEGVLCFWQKQDEAVANVPVVISKAPQAGEEAPPLQGAIPSGILVKTGKKEINQNFVDEVNELIESYLIQEQCPTVEILSKEMNMSFTKFRTEMKRNTGMSPFKYVFACRMKKAKEYLALRIYKATEVAYMVAFSDPRYFRKQFKKYYHQSPTEYVESLKD